MIYTTFKQWVKGRFFASKDELALIETGWNYGYDAGVQWQKTQQALDKIADNERELNIQMQPEPVAWRAWFDADNGARWLFSLWPEEERLNVEWTPLYTAPPQRTWQGLTDEEISAIDWKQNETLHDFARAIEAKLRSKNT